MSRADDEFDALAQEVCAKAAAVRCSKEDYKAGLRAIIDELEIALAAAEER